MLLNITYPLSKGLEDPLIGMAPAAVDYPTNSTIKTYSVDSRSRASNTLTINGISVEALEGE